MMMIAFFMGLFIGMAVGLIADAAYTVAITRRSRVQISDWVPRKPPLRRSF